jgi:hypothetical protein
MSEEQRQPGGAEIDLSDPALQKQTEAAIVAVCTYVARQLTEGKPQDEIRAELLKEGLPESAVGKILALVAPRPEAFLRVKRRLKRRQPLRAVAFSLLWLIAGAALLALTSQGIFQGKETLAWFAGWLAIAIGGLNLAWSGLVLYLMRPRHSP